MPEEAEVETKDIQETIEKAHEERHARSEQSGDWVKFIGLSTAIFAVFAAVGSLMSGALVNEALINQVKASDSWNEYQASKTKDHLYTVAANTLVDLGSSASSVAPQGNSRSKAGETEPRFRRLKEYRAEIAKERTRADKLTQKSKALEIEVSHQIEHHHRFAASVALIQVAIALGGIAALARIRSVWLLGLATGVVGIVLFAMGFLG